MKRVLRILRSAPDVLCSTGIPSRVWVGRYSVDLVLEEKELIRAALNLAGVYERP